MLITNNHRLSSERPRSDVLHVLSFDQACGFVFKKTHPNSAPELKRDCMRAWLEGLKLSVIAELLGCSSQTVVRHVRTFIRKADIAAKIYAYDGPAKWNHAGQGWETMIDERLRYVFWDHNKRISRMAYSVEGGRLKFDPDVAKNVAEAKSERGSLGPRYSFHYF